jgi:alkylation response protein AidB-like acyl-CoA dehydrogenase
MLDLFPLTEEQREIERVAHDFAAVEIVPYSKQWDRDSYFEPTLVKKLGDLGFLGMLTAE